MSEPPKKSRAAMIVALAIAGAIALLGVTTVAAVVLGPHDPTVNAKHDTSAPADGPSPTASSEPPHSITIPNSVGEYRRVKGNVADRIIGSMRKSMGKAEKEHAAAYAKAKIGIYAKGGDLQHMLIFIGMAGNDIPELGDELGSSEPSDEVDGLFLGMGIANTKGYPAGPLGGVLRCGTGRMDGIKLGVCGWADHSVLGVVMAPASGGIGKLADVTLNLRDSAEH